jgi:hypothetical protein
MDIFLSHELGDQQQFGPEYHRLRRARMKAEAQQLAQELAQKLAHTKKLKQARNRRYKLKKKQAAAAVAPAVATCSIAHLNDQDKAAVVIDQDAQEKLLQQEKRILILQREVVMLQREVKDLPSCEGDLDAQEKLLQQKKRILILQREVVMLQIEVKDLPSCEDSSLDNTEGLAMDDQPEDTSPDLLLDQATVTDTSYPPTNKRQKLDPANKVRTTTIATSSTGGQPKPHDNATLIHHAQQQVSNEEKPTPDAPTTKTPVVEPTKERPPFDAMSPARTLTQKNAAGEQHRDTLQKLTDSIIPKETCRALQMTNAKTVKFARSKSVSKVLSSNEQSARQLQSYLHVGYPPQSTPRMPAPAKASTWSPLPRGSSAAPEASKKYAPSGNVHPMTTKLLVVAPFPAASPNRDNMTTPQQGTVALREQNLPSKVQVQELRGKRNNEKETSPPPQQHQQQGVTATSPNANNTPTCRLLDCTPNGSAVSVATVIHITPKTTSQALFPTPPSLDDILCGKEFTPTPGSLRCVQDVCQALPVYVAAATSTATKKESVQGVYLAATATGGRFLQGQNHKELGKEDAMVRVKATFESMGKASQNPPIDAAVLTNSATLASEFEAAVIKMDLRKPTGTALSSGTSHDEQASGKYKEEEANHNQDAGPANDKNHHHCEAGSNSMREQSNAPQTTLPTHETGLAIGGSRVNCNPKKRQLQESLSEMVGDRTLDKKAWLDKPNMAQPPVNALGKMKPPGNDGGASAIIPRLVGYLKTLWGCHE